VGHKRLAGLASLAVVMLLSTASAAAAPQRTEGVPAFGHVFVIVGENTSLSQVTPTHAPYLSSSLKPMSAWMTHYFAFNSSSLGQYVGMMSGQFTRCEKNNAEPINCHQRVANLFSQLDATHRPWFEWNESATSACDIFDSGSAWSHNIYSAHHDPALYFTNIEGGRYDEARTPSLECRSRDLAMGTTAPNDTSAFDAALVTGQVGAFNLVVPNDCENGHDPCGTRDPVRQFDSFLAREVPKIEASPAFGADGLIAITWDEGGDPPKDPRHVLLALKGPSVKPGVYAGTRLDHYSLLRTLEDGLAVSRLANARKAPVIRGVWR
jgi:phosphatidylinositol-3-phosphatase